VKKQVRLLKTCKGCGKGFQPKNKKQKYCNDNCREEYYDRHYYGKVEVTKTCPNCGTKFPTTMPKKQTYCSPDCRKDAAGKRAEGIVASRSAERMTYLAERYSAMERDGFKCVLCGRGAADGVSLDVESTEAGALRTICEDCKTGKEFSGEKSSDEA